MQIIKDIFNLPEGAVWLKADLHVHTPASQDISEKWANSKAEDVVRIALEKQLDIIAITDHNTVAWCDDVVKAAEGTGLTVFPGVAHYYRIPTRIFFSILLFLLLPYAVL